MTEWRWSVEHGMTVRRAGAGPELVWIHGLGEWSITFDQIANHPALAGFTHVLVDLPGYGRSASSNIADDHDSLEQLADHLISWLGSGARPVLIGHSMGGVVAALVAERCAVRGLVMIDANLSAGDCFTSGRIAAFDREAFVAREFAAFKAELFERARTEPVLRGYHAAMLSADPIAVHRHATDLVAISERADLAARLAALSMPVLFIAGVPDGICAESRALLDYHRVHWVAIEPAGHWVFVDQPGPSAEAIREFLRELATVST
ncbi:MAG: alpha/beta fold hydrolase [Kofleriaceae bacterium]